MERDTLLLIDGHSLVYRAFFAMPALTNSRGEVTNAAYGFTSMLLKALGDHHPTHAVAAFDPPGRTFRHEQDATYKAGRKPTPEDLIPQFPWCREVVEALGIPIIEVPTFEADDVIGTLSVQGEKAGLDVIIVTGDLDALQLVTEQVRVFANRRGISDTIVYDVDKRVRALRLRPAAGGGLQGAARGHQRQHPGRARHRRQDGDEPGAGARPARGHPRRPCPR